MRGSRVAAATVMAVLAGVTVACAPPSVPSGTVLTPGCVDGVVLDRPTILYFDAEAGQVLSLAFTLVSSEAFQVFDPAGNLLAPQEARFFSPLRFDITATGRHRIVVSQPERLNQDYRLCVSTDVDLGTIGLGVVDVPPTVPGQRVIYRYLGAAGEVLNVSENGPSLSREIEDPSGQRLPGDQRNRSAVLLPSAGEYRVILRNDNVVQPSAGPTELALSHDIDGGTIGLGTTPYPPLLPGQEAVFRYDSTQGELLEWQHAQRYYYRETWIGPGGPWIPVPNSRLSQFGGQGYLVVDADSGPGFLRLTNSRDLGTVTKDTPAVVEPLDPGQSVIVRYQGTAGEQIRVAVTPAPAGGTVEFDLSADAVSSVRHVDEATLSRDALHWIRVPQPDGHTGPFTLEVRTP